MKKKRGQKKKRSYHSINRRRKRPPIIVRLRQLIEQEIADLVKLTGKPDSKLPSNYFSFRSEATRQAIATGRTRYVRLDEIDALWNAWSAQCERALLEGDADWFKRQAHAMERGDRRTDQEKDRGRFEAEVARLLIIDRVPERKILADDKNNKCFNLRYDTAPLTNEEKQTIRDFEWSGCTHAVIEDEIGKCYKRADNGDYIAASKGRGALIVEWTLDKQRHYSCRFKNRRCARDCVRDIAKRINQGHRFL
jgi:hypothetical protein